MSDHITVIFCEPGKKAVVKEIDSSLESMQKVVEGYIEACYVLPDAVIICNEEGKINNMIPNRAVYDEEGKRVDVIYGPFFICGIDEGEMISLPEDLQEKYLKQFELPELIYVREGKVHTVQYDPT